MSKYECENKKYNDMVEYLKEHIGTIGDLVCECNGYDYGLEDYVWYEHDEYFYENFFNNKEEVARAVYYGGCRYNFTEPYVRFNAYGNLETCCEYEYDDMLKRNAEEILDKWLELYADNNVDTWDDEFKALVRTFYEEDEVVNNETIEG